MSPERGEELEKYGRTGGGDPSLLAAVGGYQKRRRPGWYLALVLLGFGLGALLALAVGKPPAPVGEGELPVRSRPGQPTPAAIRAGLVFATSQTAPERTPDMIASGVKQVYCHFRLPGVESLESLSGHWSCDGEEQGKLGGSDFSGEIDGKLAVGYAVLQAQLPAGFRHGIYEVTIRTADGVVREGSFVVVDDPDKILSKPVPEAVGVQVAQATICPAVNERGEPQAPRAIFATDDDKVYIAFKFSNAEPGSVVAVEWQFHEEAIPSATREITLDSTEGWAHAWIGRDSGGLLVPGGYRAVVKSVPDGQPLASAAFQVKADQ